MNKKLMMITIACLMSVRGISAFSVAGYMPTWQSVRNAFSMNSQRQSAFKKYVAEPISNNIVAPIQNAVRTGQEVAVYTSAPRFAWGFMNDNPHWATGLGLSVIAPKLIIPFLGGSAAAYTLNRHQATFGPDETDWSEQQKTESQKRRITQQIFAGLGGVVATYAFMKKPLVVAALSVLAGSAYKFKIGPFAKNADANDDSMVCEDGVCTIP